MRVRRFSATLLVGLFFSPNGFHAVLRHVDPVSLEPTGAKLQLELFNEIQPSEGRVAVWTRKTVQVVDTAALRVEHSYPLARKDVCTVQLDGTSAVALVGCTLKSPRRYALIRLGPLGRTTVRVRGHLAVPSWPTSFAYGDGKLFLARGSGEVDVVDGATGNVRVHPAPKRSLAKGGVPYVEATWLGEHQLGLNGAVVDVRTWRRHVLAPHGRRIDASGQWLTTYGSAGVAVWTRDFHLYRRFLRGEFVDQAKIDDGVLYAQIALVWHRFDVRTGKSLGQIVPDASWQMRLL